MDATPDKDEAITPAPLKRFVVGIDLSPESLYALDLAAAMGAPHSTALRIVHVHPHPSSLGFSPMAAAEYEQSQSTVDDLVGAEAAKRLENYPGHWTPVVRHGQAGHELLAEADNFDADLLVVGHRSHGLIRDALLGSVATGAVHHSRRSILVAIPPQTGR